MLIFIKNINKQTNKYNMIVNKKFATINTVQINEQKKLKMDQYKAFFPVYTLLYWSKNYNYTLLNTNFLSNKIYLKYRNLFYLNFKSEVLFSFGKRNSNVIVHAPRVSPLVYKKYFVHRETARDWNNDNLSELYFGFSTGRCGFKPTETKSFIATDTLVRTLFWCINRHLKKLSPFRLRLKGKTSIFRKYANRFTPSKGKLFKFIIASVEDATPIPFNGCRLEHMARKRYRRHAYQYGKIAKNIKMFNSSVL